MRATMFWIKNQLISQFKMNGLYEKYKDNILDSIPEELQPKDERGHLEYEYRVYFNNDEYESGVDFKFRKTAFTSDGKSNILVNYLDVKISKEEAEKMRAIFESIHALYVSKIDLSKVEDHWDCYFNETNNAFYMIFVGYNNYSSYDFKLRRQIFDHLLALQKGV